MSKFFNHFPLIEYNLSGANGNTKTVTDIFRRVKVRSKLQNNLTLYDKYDVQEGEKPEDVAYKAYGDADYFWVITLINNIVNRYYDWPLDEYVFQQYVADKYPNPETVHHYEITQSSGRQAGDGPSDYSHKVECNATDAGAEAVTNIQYERRLQDEKRQIRILMPAYLPTFEDEFIKLIRK